MFRLNRNERSHWSGNGVHVESELVFMIGRNMHKHLFTILIASRLFLIFCDTVFAMTVVLCPERGGGNK